MTGYPPVPGRETCSWDGDSPVQNDVLQHHEADIYDGEAGDGAFGLFFDERQEDSFLSVFGASTLASFFRHSSPHV